MTDRQSQLIEDFNFIEDSQERLSAVVDRARRLPPLPETQRIDANRVPGCISQVWLLGELHDGLCQFHCDADGPLVRGLVALLCEYFSESTPTDIMTDDTDPLAELGLLANLSPTRQNGLTSVRAAIRAFAEDHS